jgi:hypothetical protein
MKRFGLIGVVLVSLAAASCASPAAPSTTGFSSLTGNWSGTATDSQGGTNVTWQLTQTGTTVSGTVRTMALNPDDGSCSSCHRNKSGSVSGTLNGNALTLTLFFAAGANGDPTPACSATLNLSAPATSASRVVAAYSGADTCEGQFANGTMTMAK